MILNKKRVLIGLIAGATLGIFCIIGAQLRSGNTMETSYLFAFWYNRLLMGFVIGMLGAETDIKKALLRGLFVGLFVSFAFYSATGFLDVIGFLAGIIYGVIIEYVAYKVT